MTTSLAEVSLVAPGAEERRAPGWLGRATAHLTRELAADGVGYVAVPRRWRFQAARLATQHGLEVGPWLLHLPPLPDSLYVIPIERRTLRYAFDALVPGHRWTRRLLPAVLAAGGASLLTPLLPSVGLVVRRPGARPLLEWLLRSDGAASETGPDNTHGTAVLALSWRGARGGAVLHRFRGAEPRPDVVAKVAPEGLAPARHAEAERLARFGPDADRAGAAVPRPLAATTVGSRAVLVQTAVRGRSAAALLASSPARLPDVAGRLTRWLGRWHAITRVDGARGLPSRVLESLDRLAPHVPGGDRYRRWLAARHEALSAVSMPLVAAHNDLTMSNVLVAADGAVGIVDWEHATADSLPLVDFFYAMADAVLIADACRDRLAAVAACVGPGGARTALVAPLWRGLTTGLALPPGGATIALHACWIHHAVNAQAEPAGATGARVFVDIVRWLAQHHVELGSGASG